MAINLVIPFPQYPHIKSFTLIGYRMFISVHCHMIIHAAIWKESSIAANSPSQDGD